MIINQMIRLFQQRGCDVRLMSDDPDDDVRPDVPWVEPLVPSWPTPDGPRRSRPALIADLARQWVRPPRRHAAFAWADVCVSAGGGYLYDDGGRASRLNLALRLLTLRAARSAQVPVVLFSQSVGPFASRLSALVVGRELPALPPRRRPRAALLRRVLTARHRASGALRRRRLRPAPCRIGQRAPTPPTIGVTVMNTLPGIDEPGYRAYRAALRDGLVEALAGTELEVVVVSQVAAHEKDSDTAAAAELASDLVARGLRARFVDLGGTPDAELSAFYGGMTLVVASRLHSGILALCAGTPILGLSYLPKTAGVLARLGWETLVLPAAGLESAALSTAIRGALDRLPILEAELQERLPAIPPER